MINKKMMDVLNEIEDDTVIKNFLIEILNLELNNIDDKRSFVDYDDIVEKYLSDD